MTAKQDDYTVGDLCSIFNLTPNTVRKYSDKFKAVLSDRAGRVGSFKNASKRIYNPTDLLVMNTILNNKRMNDDDLIARIKRGELDTDLPETSALVMPSGASTFSTIVTLKNEIQALVHENTRLRDENEKLRSETIEQRIENERKIAVLEYRLEQALKDAD